MRSSTVIREQATWCKLMALYEFVRGKQERPKENKLKILGSAAR